MTKYRWIGDPHERAAGKQITPGPWQDMPADEHAAGKIMGNNHYEIEGVKVLEVEAPKKRRAAARPQAADDLSEESGGWN